MGWRAWVPDFIEEGLGLKESDEDRKKRLSREAEERATAQAQRLRDEYLAPMLRSGEKGIRGGYARGRQQVRDATGAQARGVLQHASARGLHHSGATGAWRSSLERSSVNI